MKLTTTHSLKHQLVMVTGVCGIKVVPQYQATTIPIGVITWTRWIEASQAWDTWVTWSSPPITMGKGYYTQIVWGQPPQGGDLEVLEHVRAGRKIQAIKAARARYGMGLKDAKEYVEQNYYGR